MQNEMELRSETPVDIEQIMQGLGSANAVERARSESALREHGREDVITGLIVALTEENRKQKRRRKVLHALILTYMAAMLTFCIVAHQIALIGSVASMTGVLVAGLAATQKQKAATKVLAQYDDLRGVGLLADMLGFQLEKELRAEIETALIRLLPRMKASDAALMNADQYGTLVSVLGGRQPAASNTDLMAAILKAMEQLGDEKALPNVTRLAAGSTGYTKISGSVQIAARQCLPFLQERVAMRHASAQLLRASTGAEGATCPEELLRPAADSGGTPPDQLLRAGGQENNPA